jgi:hypothetical protein
MAADVSGAVTSPAKKSLRQLVAEMSAGELWGLIGVVAGLVAGAFVLGDWYRGKAAALEIAGVRLEDQKLVDKAEAELRVLKGSLATAEELNRSLKVKSEFFEHTARYYRTRQENSVEARKLFIDFYRRLASRENDLKANGYFIRHGQQSPTKDCRIVFADSPIPYDVPQDVKGQAILNESDL